MSNIDKQAVQAVADLKAGYTLGHADVAILNELARIALASLEAEPVCYLTWHQGFRAPDDCEEYVVEAKPGDKSCDGSPAFPVYAAQPAPVSESEPVAWASEEALAEVCCGETGMIGLQYMVGNIPLYLHAQHAPVVPDEVNLAIENLKQKLVECNRYNYCSDAVKRVEDSFRAAMLKQGNNHG